MLNNIVKRLKKLRTLAEKHNDKIKVTYKLLENEAENVQYLFKIVQDENSHEVIKIDCSCIMTV